MKVLLAKVTLPQVLPRRRKFVKKRWKNERSDFTAWFPYVVVINIDIYISYDVVIVPSYIRLSGERLFGKNEHATIPKGKMGYDQYTVPDTIASCRTYTFVAFIYHSQTYIHGLSCPSFKFLWRIVNPKTIHIIPFAIVACTFSESVSRNSCIRVNVRLMA